MKTKRRFFELLAEARYLSKRIAGISATRKDGSKCSEENDIQSTAAEYEAAQNFGCPFNFSIDSKGDGGNDFTLNVDFEVIWLGVNKNKTPRTIGHLIVNPDEPQRWADVYLVVSGDIDTGFTTVGWTTHKKLIKQPMKDFGFGKKYAMHVDDLYKSDLRMLKKDI